MSEMAALLGEPLPFEFDKQLYQVHPRTFAVEAQFSLWLESEALKVLQRHQGGMLPGEYDRAYDRWVDRCAAHVYEYGGEVANKSMDSPAASKEIAFLTLQYGNRAFPQAVLRKTIEGIFADEGTPQLDDKGEPVRSAAGAFVWAAEPKWLELFGVMRRANDPNRQRQPATPAAAA